jgi:hypothetical protein
MKYFEWPIEKNIKLMSERNISFERVVWHIENGHILDIVDHPNMEKYPKQKMFILDIEDYVYCVPFVEVETSVFLKTIFPSRKLTLKYLGA